MKKEDIILLNETLNSSKEYFLGTRIAEEISNGINNKNPFLYDTIRKYRVKDVIFYCLFFMQTIIYLSDVHIVNLWNRRVLNSVSFIIFVLNFALYLRLFYVSIKVFFTVLSATIYILLF